jgi:hypothetical protein
MLDKDIAPSNLRTHPMMPLLLKFDKCDAAVQALSGFDLNQSDETRL